jgi:hypothetical protein
VLVENHSLFINLVIDAVDRRDKFLVTFTRKDQQVDRHRKAFEQTIRDLPRIFHRVYYNGQIQIAASAMVSTGTRTECDDAQGISRLNDPPDGFLDTLRGHPPIQAGSGTSSNGLGRHGYKASLSCSLF